MARTRLTNPQPLVELKRNPYQIGFLNARRMRVCRGDCTAHDGTRLWWSQLEGINCPKCGQVGIRAYRRFYLRAGRRGGKTRIGALSAIEEATVPYSIGWCCAPSYPELEDYVLPAFFSQLPAEWFDHPLTEWSEDRLDLRLPNRAIVQFRSLDDESRGAGPSLDWAWIDEGRKVREMAWNLLQPALVDRKGIAWVTSSPDWGEDWCHRQFWIPASEGRPGYWACEYRTVDNPIIDPAEVELARATMPPALFRREFEASIEYPSGTIYGELIDQVEATDDRIRQWIPEWPSLDSGRIAVIGLDPGTDHPFAGALVIVTPRGLVVAGEYLEREAPFATHAAGLKLLRGNLNPRWGIDRSAAQAAIELNQHGIFPSTAGLGGPGSVMAGIQRVYSWGAAGKLLISRTKCPRLLRQLRGYRYADVVETKLGIGKDVQVYKKDDDLPDALRYAVMLWPELPTSIDLETPLAGNRNLSLLNMKARSDLVRNIEEEANEEGLVRVTDDWTPIRGDERPLGDSALGDFYR